MADIRISDLTQVSNLNNGDMVEVSQENAQAQTGYTSMKASMTDLGNKVNNSLQFTSALQTTAKTIIGAINELFGRGLKDLSDTTITTPSSGQVLAYDGSKWVNSDKILYISLGGNSTATVNCGYGTVIFMVRQSIGRHCIYMIDGWGSIEPIIESHQDLTLSYSNGVLTITNTTSSGRSVTVLKA